VEPAGKLMAGVRGVPTAERQNGRGTEGLAVIPGWEGKIVVMGLRWLQGGVRVTDNEGRVIFYRREPRLKQSVIRHLFAEGHEGCQRRDDSRAA